MSEAKPENQIDYIELPASDIEKSKTFHSSVFGWKFEDYGPDYTSFRDGRMADGGFISRIRTAMSSPCGANKNVYFFTASTLMPAGIATRKGGCLSVAENEAGSFDVRTQTVCVAPLANWISTGISTEKSLSTALCSTVPVTFHEGALPLTE